MSKHLIEFNGKIACVKEHCEDMGINPNNLWVRKHRTGETDLECLEYFQKNGVSREKNPILIEFNGKIATLKEHCEDLGISPQSVRARKRKLNITIEECLTYYLKNEKQPNKQIFVEFNGKVATLDEHCRDLGIKVCTVKSRHQKTGESYSQCLSYYQKYGLYKHSSLIIYFNNKLATLVEHCDDLGVKYSTVQSRHYKTGEPYEKCLEYYQNKGVRHVKFRYKAKDYRLYSRWYNMMERCYNPKCVSYPRYGGKKPKPIKVCDRWQNYENFEEDMLDSFLEHVKLYGLRDTTLERDNPDGDYCPENCAKKKWATQKEQQNNRSNNVWVINDLTVAQFSEKYNIPYHIVLGKTKEGLTAEEIIEQFSLKNS